MRRCRNSKGRFTKCRGRKSTSRRRKASTCRFGKVKSGPRKGLCRKQRRRRRR